MFPQDRSIAMFGQIQLADLVVPRTIVQPGFEPFLGDQPSSEVDGRLSSESVIEGGLRDRLGLRFGGRGVVVGVVGVVSADGGRLAGIERDPGVIRRSGNLFTGISGRSSPDRRADDRSLLRAREFGIQQRLGDFREEVDLRFKSCFCSACGSWGAVRPGRGVAVGWVFFLVLVQTGGGLDE